MIKQTVLALFLAHGALGYAQAEEAATRQAEGILAATGIQGGLVVHVGCGDGKLTAAFRRNDSYLVQGLTRDEQDVETAGRYFRSRGTDGKVSAVQWDGKVLPYADGIVKLLVIRDGADVPEKEIMRVLTPEGVVWQDGKKTLKPWPGDMDEWTHWLHGPGSNPVSADTRVGPPRRMRWTAPPRRARSHEKSPSLTGMVSAGGRLFYIADEAPASVGGRAPDRWRLVARDAFSGVLLWKRPMPDWGWQAWSPSQPMNLRWGNPRFIHRRLVAVDNRVYVTLGYHAPVSVLDAATGEVLRTLEGTEHTSEILVHKGKLIVSAADRPAANTKSAPDLSIRLVDPATGSIEWAGRPMPSIMDNEARGKANVLKQGRLMIAADGSRVVAVTVDEIVGYDFSSGQALWKVARPLLPRQARLPVTGPHNLGLLIADQGRVYFGQPAGRETMTLLCLAADTGKTLWERKASSWTYSTNFNAYAMGDRLVVRDQMKYLVLDAATGEEIRRWDVTPVSSRHHHRCYRNKATTRYVLMGKEGVEYLDLQTGKVTVNRWVRGSCLYGIMPANGLLYATPEACACNQMNRIDGFTALAAAAKPVRPEHPLVAGPARGSAGNTLPAQSWPQYRRDSLRSAFAEMTPRQNDGWRVKLEGELTAPVSDGKALYFGCGDVVVALHCSNGKELWRVPGRIDSPPTLHKGLVLYGTRTGWVHCRRASDGQLAWRFRAAPAATMIVDDDRLESVWPLHGSVMLFNNNAYAVAGRSSHLDGGLRLFALDPETGDVLATSTFATEQTQQADWYEGVNNDLLVSDGESLFLRHMKIDPETLKIERLYWWSFTGADGRMKNYSKPEINVPVAEERTPYLCAPSGLLDDELFGRAHVQLDGSEFCNRLTFNQDFTYGIRHSKGPGHFQFHTLGAGFPVICFDRRSDKKPTPEMQKKVTWQQGSLLADYRAIWTRSIPLRPSAILGVGEQLLIGGGPDIFDPEDPLSSPEWQAGGLVYVINRTDGTVVKTGELSAPPVHEGLIAVPAGLFACLKDATVLRLGKEVVGER